MAWEFVDASSESLSDGTSLSSLANPLTFSCWFYPTSEDYMQLFTFADNSVGSERLGLEYDGSDIPGNAFCAAYVSTGINTKKALGTLSIDTINEWHHVVGVFTSDTSRDCYVDGANKGSNTESIIFPTNMDTVGIGAVLDTNQEFSNSRIAEAAIWNVALTTTEIESLAAGYSPSFIRPQSLIYYPSLMGATDPPIDSISGTALTKGGTPTLADHAPIIYPYIAPPLAVTIRLNHLSNLPASSIPISSHVPQFVISGFENTDIPLNTIQQTNHAPTFDLVKISSPALFKSPRRVIQNNSHQTIIKQRL